MLKSRRLLSTLLIGQAACAMVAALHFGGVTERLDLIAYDLGIQARADRDGHDDRIVLVTAHEEDISRLGWPLSDGILADLLETLTRSGTLAIGVDIYRDRPVPPGSERLDSLLASNPSIVWGYLFGTDLGRPIPAPAVLGQDRTGFIDVLTDRDGTVRRGLLFMHDAAAAPHTSLPMMLALRYLEPMGVVPEEDAQVREHLRLGRATLPPLEPGDGPYAGIDAQGYQYLLDYTRGSQPFAAYSVSQVLAGQIPREALAGRLVLVAVTAESVKDLFKTPLASGDTAAGFSHGVTVHAQATAQLLRAALEGTPPLRDLPVDAELLAIWLAGTAGSLTGLMLRGILPFAAAAAAGVALIVAFWLAALHVWLWLPIAAPVLVWLSVLSLVTAYLSRLERTERAMLMRLFASHLSEPVAEDIWRQRATFLEGGRPKPQRLTATVLFSDIAGFSTISERLEPEVLTGWLDFYLDVMSRTVLDHSGIVLRFIGDAILAVFGVPVPRTGEAEVDRDAQNAVRCALAMAKALKIINERCRHDGLPAVAIRIGIHTGSMVAGSMGTSEHLEYSLVGDSVNTAARLEALSKQIADLDGDGSCPILIGEATWKRLGGRFSCRLVGTLPLKGKVEAVAVYQITGTADENHIIAENIDPEMSQRTFPAPPAWSNPVRRAPSPDNMEREES
jgi:adenylate cyclase